MITQKTHSEIADVLITERLRLRDSHADRAAFTVLNRIAAQLAPQDDTKYSWLCFCGVPKIDATRLAATVSEPD